MKQLMLATVMVVQAVLLSSCSSNGTDDPDRDASSASAGAEPGEVTSTDDAADPASTETAPAAESTTEEPATCVTQLPVEEKPNPFDLLESGGDVVEAAWGVEGESSTGLAFTVSEPEKVALSYATNTLYFVGVGTVEGMVGGDAGPECVYEVDFAIVNHSADRVTVNPNWLNFWRGDTPLPVWLQGAGLVVPGSGGLVDLEPGDRIEMRSAVIAASDGDFALDLSTDGQSHVVIH